MQKRRKRVSAADRRTQILAVARKLFARQGFRGTTTRQIADQASVNEAILFRYFHRKDELYWAVLDEMSRGVSRREKLQSLVTDHEKRDGSRAEKDERFFAGVAETMIQRSRKEPELGRLVLFSALERHSLSQRFFRTYIADYWDLLAEYIRGRMRAGEFKTFNPLLAARSFIGMVGHYILMQGLFGAGKYQQFDDRVVCRTLARIWLGGMSTGRRGKQEK